MKKLSFLFLLLFYSIKPEAQSWTLVWSDEFTSGTIDPANWNFEIGNGGWGNNELEYYTNQQGNATITNGNLLIIAKQEFFGGSNYTSARMNTKGLHYWTYGKIEARIKLTMTQGIWPAFWMLGENITQVGWPECGELDIMEHINNDTKIVGTMHWDNLGHVQYGTDTSCDVTQFHVYSIEWDKNTIKWFLDGNVYLTALIENNIHSTEEFHNPFYIILNMAVGGNWPGNPDGTSTFPDTMYVDYVTVYQKENSNSIKESMNKNSIMNIFPNPSGGKFTFEFMNKLGQLASFKIYNVLGEIIYTPHIQKHQTSYEIDLSNFPGGIYFLTINDGDKIHTEKILIH